jgi:hypothetical protein
MKKLLLTIPLLAPLLGCIHEPVYYIIYTPTHPSTNNAPAVAGADQRVPSDGESPSQNNFLGATPHTL